MLHLELLCSVPLNNLLQSKGTTSLHNPSSSSSLSSRAFSSKPRRFAFDLHIESVCFQGFHYNFHMSKREELKKLHLMIFYGNPSISQEIPAVPCKDQLRGWRNVQASSQERLHAPLGASGAVAGHPQTRQPSSCDEPQSCLCTSADWWNQEQHSESVFGLS